MSIKEIRVKFIIIIFIIIGSIPSYSQSSVIVIDAIKYQDDQKTLAGLKNSYTKKFLNYSTMVNKNIGFYFLFDGILTTSVKQAAMKAGLDLLMGYYFNEYIGFFSGVQSYKFNLEEYNLFTNMTKILTVPFGININIKQIKTKIIASGYYSHYYTDVYTNTDLLLITTACLTSNPMNSYYISDAFFKNRETYSKRLIPFISINNPWSKKIKTNAKISIDTLKKKIIDYLVGFDITIIEPIKIGTEHYSFIMPSIKNNIYRGYIDLFWFRLEGGRIELVNKQRNRFLPFYEDITEELWYGTFGFYYKPMEIFGCGIGGSYIQNRGPGLFTKMIIDAEDEDFVSVIEFNMNYYDPDISFDINMLVLRLYMGYKFDIPGNPPLKDRWEIANLKKKDKIQKNDEFYD